MLTWYILQILCKIAKIFQITFTDATYLFYVNIFVINSEMLWQIFLSSQKILRILTYNRVSQFLENPSDRRFSTSVYFVSAKTYGKCPDPVERVRKMLVLPFQCYYNTNKEASRFVLLRVLQMTRTKIFSVKNDETSLRKTTCFVMINFTELQWYMFPA